MMKRFFLLLLSSTLVHAELRVVTDFEEGNAEMVGWMDLRQPTSPDR